MPKAFLDNLNRNIVEERATFYILKQKLAATSAALRRYKQRVERKNQNILFQLIRKPFYRKLYQGRKNRKEATPSIIEMGEFWSNKWSNPKMERRNPDPHRRLPRGITNWNKQFTSINTSLVREFNRLISSPELCSNFLKRDTTFLFPKSDQIANITTQ